MSCCWGVSSDATRVDSSRVVAPQPVTFFMIGSASQVVATLHSKAAIHDIFYYNSGRATCHSLYMYSIVLQWGHRLGS